MTQGWSGRLWTRLRPRSMSAQLVCLLFGGLLVSHVIALAIVTEEQRLHPLARQHALDKFAIGYRLLALAPTNADDAIRLLAAVDAGFHTNADSTLPATATTMNADEQRVQTQLAAMLNLDASAVRVRVRPVAHDPRIADLTVALQLADGRWFHGAQQPKLVREWWRPLRVSVPASVIPVLLIIFFFVRRVLQPVEALARAAHSISRGEQIAPLPLVGPRETRDVTAAFNLMQERLRRFIEDRSYMLAAISHDLRTPITSLRVRAELIDEPELRTIMKNTLAELAEMVGETLSFASEDARSEPTRELDLDALLRAIANDQQMLGHPVQYKGTGPLPYRCRPTSLKRALINLIDNAVRYGQSAQIGIEANSGNNGNIGSYLRIVIDDQGPGIAAERMADVFQPFFRIDPSRQRGVGGGVGLGLSIARTCIEAHGGELTLTNRSQWGLRATVVLPT
ncbi:MAG: ATP-binding protein [Duganella sp.]